MIRSRARTLLLAFAVHLDDAQYLLEVPSLLLAAARCLKVKIMVCRNVPPGWHMKSFLFLVQVGTPKEQIQKS